MPDKIFDPDSTQKQLDKLRDLPPEEGGIGATFDGQTKDIGVRGRYHKDIGKPGGWFTVGEGSWMRRAGYSVAGWLGWRGKE